MSGLVSAITKVFTSIGSGIASGAATLGSAVRGVGASLFTGMAATGTGVGDTISSLFSGGGIGSTLHNMFNGALDVMGLSPTASALSGASSVGGAAGATGATAATGVTGLGSAAGVGSTAGTAAVDALAAAPTPTGAAAVGPSITTTPGATAGAGAGGGLGSSLLSSLTSKEVLGGLLQGYGEYSAMEDQTAALERQQQANRDFLQGQKDQITASYNVPNSALVGGTPDVMWAYNADTGRVEKQMRPRPQAAQAA